MLNILKIWKYNAVYLRVVDLIVVILIYENGEICTFTLDNDHYVWTHSMSRSGSLEIEKCFLSVPEMSSLQTTFPQRYNKQSCFWLESDDEDRLDYMTLWARNASKSRMSVLCQTALRCTAHVIYDGVCTLSYYYILVSYYIIREEPWGISEATSQLLRWTVLEWINSHGDEQNKIKMNRMMFMLINTYPKHF